MSFCQVCVYRDNIEYCDNYADDISRQESFNIAQPYSVCDNAGKTILLCVMIACGVIYKL